MTLREEIFDNILEVLQSVQCVQNDIQIEVTESSVNSLEPGLSTDGPRKKKKKNALMEQIGNKFQSNECNTTNTTATSDTTL